MRKTGCMLLVLALLALSAVPAAAQDGVYHEVFTGTENNEIRQFQNMVLHQWPALAQEAIPGIYRAPSGSQTASVRFQVSGAQEVTLHIVSRLGSFYTLWEDGSTTVGPVLDGNTSLSRLHTMRYDPQTGEAYALVLGVWHRLELTSRGLRLNPDNPAAESRLVDLGVNLYASASPGGAETRIPLQRTAVSYDAATAVSHVEETFQLAGRLPAGTAYLRIELNDLNVETMPDPSAQRTSIASATFRGDSLWMGKPEEDGGGDGAEEPGGAETPDPGNSGGQDGGGQPGTTTIVYEEYTVNRIVRADPPASGGQSAAPSGAVPATGQSTDPAEGVYYYLYELSPQDRELLRRFGEMDLEGLLAMLGVEEEDGTEAISLPAGLEAARSYRLMEDPEIYAIPLTADPLEEWMNRAVWVYVALLLGFLGFALVRGRRRGRAKSSAP